MWVFGAAERAAADTKSMRFFVVENRTKETLHKIILDNID